MQKLALIMFTLACPTLGQSAAVGHEAVYESIDGRTTLMVSGDYYYIGPRNHPDVKGFIIQYGQKLQKLQISGGRCLSLGTFKLAVIEGAASVCQNVRIRKLSSKNRDVSEYVATCYELKGDGCSPARAQGKPALVYAYKVEGRRGITEIYLSEVGSRNPSNILKIKAGTLL